MAAEDVIKRFLRQGIEKLFDIDKLRFNKIIIKKEVLEEASDYAKNAYPKEFLAFLQGAIKNSALVIDGLIYHEYLASENSAMPIFHFADKSFYGTIHSHPSHNNRPSRADLGFFRKMGIIHCIISNPYTPENMRFYDYNGEEINISIE